MESLQLSSFHPGQTFILRSFLDRRRWVCLAKKLGIEARPLSAHNVYFFTRRSFSPKLSRQAHTMTYASIAIFADHHHNPDGDH